MDTWDIFVITMIEKREAISSHLGIENPEQYIKGLQSRDARGCTKNDKLIKLSSQKQSTWE